MAAAAAECADDEAADPAHAPLVARTGRSKQRYTPSGARLVAGCIPIRTRGGQLEVLMVSSRRGEGLIFPKGGWETDETVAEAAARESLEEAGVRGELQELGTFPFVSKSCSCMAHVFVLRVDEELVTWPEQEERQRVWCRVADAISLCRHAWMQVALQQWHSSLAVVPQAGEAGDGGG